MSRIDPGALAAKIREIGKKVDNEPISLERGSYVSGTISTGSLIVNLMFGGGVPPGKWTTVWGPEMSGKTTMTMSTVAQALRGDDPTPVIYFDHEAAMDPIYAANLGIRTASKNDRTKQNPYFTYTQPTTGEQTYRMILRILNEMPDFVGEPKAGRPRPSILFVIDSLAAMSPEVLIEEDEKSAMAQGGRMHSDYMRRIKAILGRKNGSIFATNQLRVKPGFCFDYSTRVVLADGTTERIGVIVKNRLPVEVMSFDPETNKVVPRKVVGWFRNGYADHFLSFKTENASGLNGYTDWACTPDHDIFTPEGEKKARDLKVGDLVLGRGQFALNKLQRSVAYGSILGDGTLRKHSPHKVELRIAHGPQQTEYLKWKRTLFGDLASDLHVHTKDVLGFTVSPSADLLDVYDEAYPSRGVRGLPRKMLKKMDLLAMAIWYMDDGTFVAPKKGWSLNGRSSISCVWLSDEDAKKLSKSLVKLGLPEPRLYTYFHKKSGKMIKRLQWNGKASRAFQEKIAPYIHPSMEHKIHADLRGRFDEIAPQKANHREKMIPVKILAIQKKPKGKYPYQMEKFDLEVEGHHTYMVGSGGVGVHNSMGDPSYEPGGEAVKFFADLKLFMRAVQKPKNERGMDMRVINLKTTKNKMFPPFKEEKEKLHVAFGRGFERYYDGLGWLEMMNRVHVVGRGDKRKKSELKFGDKAIDGSYGTNELIELLYTNKFRRFADRYMASGDAFRDYLSNTSVAPDATVNPEDAGLNFEAQKAERNKEKLKALEKRVKGVPDEPEPTTPGKRGKEKPAKKKSKK